MYTHDEGEVEVTFDDLHGEVIDTVDHSIFYGITGYDSDGNKYSATSEFCCDELVDITDIEFDEPKDFKKMKALYDAEVSAGIYDPKNPNETLAEKCEKWGNFKRTGIEPSID